jgi:hypothetical protein
MEGHGSGQVEKIGQAADWHWIFTKLMLPRFVLMSTPADRREKAPERNLGEGKEPAVD